MQKLLTLFFCAMLLIAAARAQTKRTQPLSRVDIIGLLAIGEPASEVANLARERGIAFQSTQDFLKLVRETASKNDATEQELEDTLLRTHQANAKTKASGQTQAILEHLVKGVQMAQERAGSAEGAQNLGKAEQQFRLAQQLDPSDPILHLTLGWALAEKGDRAGAQAEFEQALRLDPNSAFAHYAIGRTLAASRNMTDALREVRIATKLDPTNSNFHDSLGVLLFETGDDHAAIHELRRAIQLKPNDPMIHHDLAEVLRRKGDLKHAIVEYREAVRLKPGYYFFHYQLAEALLNRHDYKDAIGEFREVEHLKPNFAAAYSELGYCLRKQNHLNQAIAEYKEAIRLKPDFAIAHFNLGTALYKAGQRDAAYRQFQIAHDLDPANSEISAGYRRIPSRYKQFPVANSATQVHPSQPTQGHATSTPSGSPTIDDLIYAVNSHNGALIGLEAVVPVMGGSVSNFTGRVKAYIRTPGEKSPVRLAAGANLEFLMHPADLAAQLHFRLIRFGKKGGDRILAFSTKYKPSTSSSNKPGFLTFEIHKQADGSYKLAVPYTLQPGEYAFSVAWPHRLKLFCFGVDSP